MTTNNTSSSKSLFVKAVDSDIKPLNKLIGRDMTAYTLRGPIRKEDIKGDVSITYVIFVTPWSAFNFNIRNEDEVKKPTGDYDGDSCVGFVSKLTKTELEFSKCKSGDIILGNDTFDKAKHNADIVASIIGPSYTVGVGYFILGNKKKE